MKIINNIDNSMADVKQSVTELIEKMQAIDGEISEFGAILQTNGVGMTDPVVDDEGFPRQDIDVYQVRHARHRIICLQNDRKSLLSQIESGLHEIHSQARESGESVTNSSIETPRYTNPIARVDMVSPGSPSAIAGLQVHDLILEFGSVNETNFTSLQDIASVVQHSVGQMVNVTVNRGIGRLRLHLTPKIWSGRGVLGCNLLPIDSVDR